MLKIEFDHIAFLKETDSLSRKGVDFFDSCVLYCKNNNIEIELLAQIIKKNLEYKLRMATAVKKKHLLVKD